MTFLSLFEFEVYKSDAGHLYTTTLLAAINISIFPGARNVNYNSGLLESLSYEVLCGNKGFDLKKSQFSITITVCTWMCSANDAETTFV